MINQGLASHGVVWHGEVRIGMAWWGTAWSRNQSEITVGCGMSRLGTARLGVAWRGSAWQGKAWHCRQSEIMAGGGFLGCHSPTPGRWKSARDVIALELSGGRHGTHGRLAWPSFHHHGGCKNGCPGIDEGKAANSCHRCR